MDTGIELLKVRLLNTYIYIYIYIYVSLHKYYIYIYKYTVYVYEITNLGLLVLRINLLIEGMSGKH
jgi:hypothetical protein